MENSKSIDCAVNKIYGTFISGLLFTSLVVSGGAVYNLGVTKSEIPYVTEYSEQTSSFTPCVFVNSVNPMEPKFSVQIDDEKMSNLKRLEDISKLNNDWNGNGASPFSLKLISKVRMILTMLEIQPEIFPIASGGIQLEYDGPQDSYLELEINESKVAQVYRIDRNGKEKYTTIASETDAINKLVNVFYE